MGKKTTRINPDPRQANKRSLSNLRRALLRDPALNPDRRRKIGSYLLVGLWSFLSLACVTFGFPRKAGASDAPGATSSIAGTVCVNTGQGQVNNIAGVAVKLSSPSAESTSQSALTDESGGFRFAQLTAGAYTLEVDAEGFKPWTKVVALGQSEAAVEDATLEISTVDEKIEVQGEDLDVSTHSAEITGTVTNSELETLPLAEQKFTEALRLSPGVIRTPEGRVNFNGQAENQGILLVNSTENVDPVTGGFAIPVPIDVIQSMSVHTSPDTAEFGGFSGGLTEIETRPALDTWNFKLHDVSPSFRGKNGHLVGIGAFTPRMVFGGPLIKGKLNFTEELTYEVRNHEVRGLSWPFNETKTRSVTSFTQWQFILSSRHLLEVNLNIFPLRRQFADINSLVPQSASNTYGQNGASVGISDSYQLSSGGLLNTVVRYTRFDSHAHGQGAEDMLVTPDGWGGNFFNSWSRNANELEIRPAFQFPEKSWHGRHEVKIGVDVSRRSFVGTDISRPIQVLRQDNSVAEEITFQGRGLQNGASTEVGEFIEDHWILDSHLAIDAGLRLSSQSIGRSASLGPHIGVAYSPTQNGRTVIRATAGTVYGHVPLLAATFLDDPTRVISFFDPSGKTIGEPITLQNAYLQSDGGSGPQFVPAMPRTSPRTFTWSVEVEREIRRNVTLKVGYLDSQTRDLLVVDPRIGATGSASALALANNGTARYRRIEATLHARPFERGDLNVTYVWSRSRGDLNTLADTYTPFEEPVVRPNASGILPSDVPHRVVTWGIFSLPWKLTFSPVVDVRTGLPYSNVDTLQNYVGVPNSLRFPTFFSLDGRLYREFPLRLPFMEKSAKRKIRLGIYTNNLTNHRNPHDVFSNVASPLFGRFAGFYHRTDGFVIDIVD
jgi:Carboxypeptidase regulatory-like domain